MPWTKDDLERLVAERAEESVQLEFKDSRALDRNIEKKVYEISKDVTAMANSAGGTIVYGISERGHCAGVITPINRSDYSKEWLNQIITSHIQPRIEGLIVHPVPLSDDNDVAYVVEIPKGSTAHQAKDRRYYRRYNCDVLPMEDYEIRDVMNRARYPIIVPIIKIVRQSELVNPPDTFGFNLRIRPEEREESVIRYYLQVRPLNRGGAFAQFVYYEVHVPDGLLVGESVIRGDNIRRDVLDVSPRGHVKYGPSWYDPVLPGLLGPKESRKIVDGFDMSAWTSSDAKVRWSCQADNAPHQTGEALLIELPVEDN